MPDILTAREILDRLVAFPTVSSRSNLDLIDWVQDYLSGHAIACVRVPDPTGEKAALYAQAGPMKPGAVVLSGHSDVVPVDGQTWTSDPFTLTERAGRLYGRGTCDMKGFDALAIAALVAAHHGGVARPLQLALSYDEEIGCTGAPVMIAHMVSQGMPRGDTVIVGEPSMMQVVTGHKGGIGYRVHMQGYEVHSSMMHQGVNAIMEAARLIGWANAVNAENSARTPAPLAAAFVPPWTSVHVGQISGGTAHNITAGDCHFGLDFRVVPGEDMADWDARFRAEVGRIDAAMKTVRPEAQITLDPYFSLPPLIPESSGLAEQLARALTGDNGTHVVSYGTEAGQFQAAGYSAAVCGPGDIAQAHQADEYLTLDQFAAGEDFMARLIGTLQ